MDTQTIFKENGDVRIYPCAYNNDSHIVAGADRASQKGRMITEDDGTSFFRPYRKSDARRYSTLMTTKHGEVRITNNTVILNLRLPKRLSGAKIAEMVEREMCQMADWFECSYDTKVGGKR